MANSKVFEFGPFRLDAAQQQLRRRGTRLKLSASRLRLLMLFLTRRGELLTRDEIAACLWSDSQNVDVVSGINTAVNQLRTQLGDDPASPKYIETVIGSGYRFIAAVAEVELPAKPAAFKAEPESIEEVVVVETAESPSLQNPLLLASDHPYWNKRIPLAMSAVLLLCAPILYLHLRTTVSRRNLPQAEVKLARVTESGDIQSADLSPDSNYLVYVRDAGGVQLLLLQQPSRPSLRMESGSPPIAFHIKISPPAWPLFLLREEPRLRFLNCQPPLSMESPAGHRMNVRAHLSTL